jgi:hypothetical protein
MAKKDVGWREGLAALLAPKKERHNQIVEDIFIVLAVSAGVAAMGYASSNYDKNDWKWRCGPPSLLAPLFGDETDENDPNVYECNDATKLTPDQLKHFEGKDPSEYACLQGCGDKEGCTPTEQLGVAATTWSQAVRAVLPQTQGVKGALNILVDIVATVFGIKLGLALSSTAETPVKLLLVSFCAIVAYIGSNLLFQKYQDQAADGAKFVGLVLIAKIVVSGLVALGTLGTGAAIIKGAPAAAEATGEAAAATGEAAATTGSEAAATTGSEAAATGGDAAAVSPVAADSLDSGGIEMVELGGGDAAADAAADAAVGAGVDAAADAAATAAAEVAATAAAEGAAGVAVGAGVDAAAAATAAAVGVATAGVAAGAGVDAAATAVGLGAVGGIEAAGAAFDATGVGAIIGVPLGIIGAIIAATTVGGAVAGSNTIVHTHNDCWKRGTVCGPGTTCQNCCREDPFAWSCG